MVPEHAERRLVPSGLDQWAGWPWQPLGCRDHNETRWHKCGKGPNPRPSGGGVMTTPAIRETVKEPEAPPVELDAALALELAEIVEEDERTAI